MADLLEKGFFLGLGALALTKEKAEQIVNELIDKGKIAREDSPDVLKDLMNRAEEEKKLFEEKFCTVLEKSITKLGLPTKKDIDTLNNKVDQILEALNKK